jgi:GNAT superfamily N-acetyltransferase
MSTAPQSFSITSAAMSDCRECAELLVEQLHEHGAEMSVEPLARILEKVVADAATGFLLLVRADQRIVGFAYAARILSAEHCGPVAWLEELYVAPAFRSHGIGTALLNEVMERARQENILAVDLEVDAAHRRAESLYRRSGFRPLDRSRWVRELKT